MVSEIDPLCSAGRVAEPEAYGSWFRAKVSEAIDDTRPTIPHCTIRSWMRFRQSSTESALLPELEWTEPAHADLIARVEYISDENLSFVKPLCVLHGAQVLRLPASSGRQSHSHLEICCCS